jgi:hypothetical protein
MANNPATGNLAILRNGQFVVGQTATATQGFVTDADGVGTLHYQWQSSVDGTTWINITGATAATYTFTTTDIWHNIRVTASYVDGAANAEFVTSPTSAYAGSNEVAPVGGPGNDVLPGNLPVIGPSSPYVIDGGAGFDLVIYSTPIVRTAYESDGSLDVGTAFTSLSGPQPINVLKNVEEVRFTDVTLVLDLRSSQDALVYELYQAALGRTPDKTGFRFWAGVADTTGPSTDTLGHAFLTAPEFAQKFGHPDNLGFVTDLYTNVLGRAGDQAGIDYWTAQADHGASREQLLVAFAASQENVQLLRPHTDGGYWVIEA